jgi:hypothetical protein
MSSSFTPTGQSFTLSAHDALEIGATPLAEDPARRDWDWFVVWTWVAALMFCAVAWIALVLIIAGVIP